MTYTLGRIGRSYASGRDPLDKENTSNWNDKEQTLNVNSGGVSGERAEQYIRDSGKTEDLPGDDEEDLNEELDEELDDDIIKDAVIDDDDDAEIDENVVVEEDIDALTGDADDTEEDI